MRHGSDQTEFRVVVRGDLGSKVLCSFTRHREANVPPGFYLIRDDYFKTRLVPRAEVTILQQV